MHIDFSVNTNSVHAAFCQHEGEKGSSLPAPLDDQPRSGRPAKADGSTTALLWQHNYQNAERS